MLIQSSLLSSVEAGLCYEFDDGKDFQCDWMPSGETCQVCLKCNKYPVDWCRKAEPMEGDRRNADDPYNSNCLRSCGQPSTASIMTEKTTPNIVYRRKAEPREGGRRNADDPYNSNCPRSCGQPSTASIMTETATPKIVNRRKAEPMEGDIRNAVDPYNSNCLRSFGQPSTASIMTEKTAPNIVYRRKAKPMEGDQKNADDPYNSNCLRSCGQPSTASIMTEKTAPNIVYRRKAELMEGDRKNTDDPYNSNCLRSCGQPSTASIMTENTAPNMVYKRKKRRKGSIAPHFKPGATDVQTSANFPSVVSSSLHLSSAEDQTAAFPVKHQIEIGKDPTLPSVFLDGVAKDTTQKKLGIDSVNDSCSSSKSNMALVSDSIETEMDDTGECSSSSVIAMDVAREDLTEKDFCINFLRSHGLLRGDTLTDDVVSVECTVTNDNICCSRSCKICGHLDSSLKMLLCDNCEDSYHPSCYSQRLKKIPMDEWFCHSCLNKRHKIFKDTINKSAGINNEMRKSRTTSVKDEMNPILLMLRDTEPYTTDVRVGKGFQATVLDWSGPVKSDEDDFPEPLKINSSEFYRLQEENMRNPTRLSSIGNWLQCREVIDKTSGAICGKWRRAPLFEIQIEDWECFCAVHWDPLHADCAVPQEVETDEVLKQLKYIEMLRPRLAANQRKSDCAKNGD